MSLDESTELVNSSLEANSSWELADQLRIITTILPERKSTRREPQQVLPFIRRRRILETNYIFPQPEFADPYSPAIFQNFTGLNPNRVSRRSTKKMHNFIKELNFRDFIREMNYYVVRIPFRQLYRNRDENADGLYYRAGFYLLLRVFGFEPTDYFDALWKKYGVLAVETPATVCLFAVALHASVEADFNVTETIVESEDGKVLPRDTKTILCAGIAFETDFDSRIRHWKAVLRDKTLLKKPNNDTEATR